MHLAAFGFRRAQFSPVTLFKTLINARATDCYSPERAPPGNGMDASEKRVVCGVEFAEILSSPWYFKRARGWSPIPVLALMIEKANLTSSPHQQGSYLLSYQVGRSPASNLNAVRRSADPPGTRKICGLAKVRSVQNREFSGGPPPWSLPMCLLYKVFRF